MGNFAELGPWGRGRLPPLVEPRFFLAPGRPFVSPGGPGPRAQGARPIGPAANQWTGKRPEPSAVLWAEPMKLGENWDLAGPPNAGAAAPRGGPPFRSPLGGPALQRFPGRGPGRSGRMGKTRSPYPARAGREAQEEGEMRAKLA